jgi:hypothetical protein
MNSCLLFVVSGLMYLFFPPYYALRLTPAWGIHPTSDVEIAFGDDDGGGGGVVGVPIARTILTIWPAMMMVVLLVWLVFPSRAQDFMYYANMIQGSSRIAQILRTCAGTV